MIDPVSLSMVRDVVAIFGVIAGFSYYVLTVRNANRVRKQAIVRQIAQDLTSVESIHRFAELLEMEWEDFDDFLRKYDSTVNKDNYAKRATMFGWFDRLGFDLYQGNLDADTLLNIVDYQAIWLLWNKFKPIFLEQRKRYANPISFRWFEYLVDELGKERVRQGLPAEYIDADGYITN